MNAHKAGMWMVCLVAVLALAPAARAATLAGFYPLDGNGIDPTGTGPTLTEPNGAATYVAGLAGQAASFNNAGTGVLRAAINASGDVNPTFSWGGWVKLNTLTDWDIFLSNDNGGWDRFTQANGGFWSVSDGGVVHSPYATTTNWTFIAHTFDGTHQHLYVDSNPVFTRNDPAPQNMHSFIEIGRNANGAFPLNGLMDGVFFFDDTLTQADVDTIRAGGPGGAGVLAVATTPPPVDDTLWSVDIQGNGSSSNGQSNPALAMSGAEPFYGYGQVWNQFNVPAHALPVQNDPSMGLVTSDGSPSGVTFTVHGPTAGWGGGGGSGGRLNLVRDYLFVDAGNVSGDLNADWTLSGLDPTHIYEIYAYGGVGRDMLFTIDMGGDGSLANDAGQLVTGNGLLFGPITPDALGNIIGTMANGTGDKEGNWGGFQLRDITPLGVIPEPATMCALGLAVAGLGGYLRRRKTLSSMLVVTLAAAMLCAGAGTARADWVDNFDQPTFDARWGFDIPNPGVASVTLDTGSDQAHFATAGNTNMWTARQDAPIMWTPSSTGDFHIETHVKTTTTQTGSTAGLAVYANADGARPDFVLQLNQWGSATGIVHLQGLGDNNPTNPTVSAGGGGEAWLRLECDRDGGAGGLDQYTAKYKLNSGDPWSTLTTYDRDTPNARMGLFLKSSAGGRIADFTYAAGSDPPPPPAPIQGGDVIKLDFSNAGDGDGGGLPGDWNQTNNGSAPIAPGSVIRHGDGAVIGGVGISFSGPGVGRGFNDDPGADGWIGEAGDPYFVPGANDIFFGPGALTTEFTGLDPALTYNVRVYSLIGNNGGATDEFSVIVSGIEVDGVTNSHATRWNASTLESGGTVFTGISPNALGRLDVTVENDGSLNGYYPLNAIVLEAVAAPIPEPATMCALGLAVAGLGRYVRRRRRG